MTYRSRQLLDVAHEAPCFLLPGQHECVGPSEPAHSDMIRHGRGANHKSHDCFAVPACHNAHLAFTRSNLGKDGYHAAWTEAMERYILWLWVSARIQITASPRAGKEHVMEAPMCKICENRHYAREPHIFGKVTVDKEHHEKVLKTSRKALGLTEKNTSREGRCVLKAQATQTDRDHLEARPASQPRKPGGDGTAAKPKTAPKKGVAK